MRCMAMAAATLVNYIAPNSPRRNGHPSPSNYVTVIAELTSAPIVAPPLLCASIHR